MKTLVEIKNDFQNHLRRFGSYNVEIDDDMICISSSVCNVLVQPVLSFVVHYCDEYHFHFYVTTFDNKPELLVFACS